MREWGVVNLGKKPMHRSTFLFYVLYRKYSEYCIKLFNKHSQYVQYLLEKWKEDEKKYHHLQGRGSKQQKRSQTTLIQQLTPLNKIIVVTASFANCGKTMLPLQ